MNFIQRTLQPAIYHGNTARPPFFEGWYFKLIDEQGRHRLAIIPGIFLGNDQHAFIQILDGNTAQSHYIRFPVEDFSADDQQFEIRVGNNTFTSSGIALDLHTNEIQLKGQLHFSNVHPWPVTWRSPGVMGWYAWVPAMECYHGVLSFNHRVHGEINHNATTISFEGGKGYIEKDWGKSFPEAWIWFQSNHFENPNACLTTSIAIIPWLRNAFRGFITGLWVDGELYRFATYTGARTRALRVTETEIEWQVQDRNHSLEMHFQRAEGGILLGPTRQAMGTRLAETLSASVEVTLRDRAGSILFHDTGKYGGLEAHGNLDRLLAMSD